MWSGISWETYLASAGVLLGIYYLVMLGLFYRQQMQRLLASLGGRHTLGRAPGEEEEPAEEEEPERFLSYEELKKVASDIRHGILEEAGKEAGKHDLLERIKTVLANSGGLRPPASRGAINHYITQQAAKICGVAVTEEELEIMWESLPR